MKAISAPLNTLDLGGKKLVIFDLDGTLVDSAGDIARALNQTLGELKRLPASDIRVKSWIGNGSKVLVERALLNQAMLDQSSEQLIVDGLLTNSQLEVALEQAHILFLSYYKRIGEAKGGQLTSCYPGVRRYLDYLNANSVDVALVSNKPHDLIEPVLAKTGLLDDFSWWAGGDYFEQKKPEPLPLLECLAHFKVLPQQALMIGDSVNDTLAAYRAGISVIAVDYGYGDLTETVEYADAVVSTLTELIF